MAQIQTEFLVGDPDRQGASEKAGAFVHHRISARTAEALAQFLAQRKPRRILLHYVGYGYAKRGCPDWLVQGLEIWKRQTPDAKLAVMFHELFASGPIWTSAFWTSAKQRNLCARLARLSTVAFTSSTVTAGILKREWQVETAMVLPVFSNFGEPAQVLPMAERQPQVLVYLRTPLSNPEQTQLEMTLRQVGQVFGIKKIVVFGKASLAAGDVGMLVDNLGLVAPDTLGRLLEQSRMGLLFYDTQWLAKSSILAAFSACGVVPVVIGALAPAVDGLCQDENFLNGGQLPASGDINLLQRLSTSTHRWYCAHRSSLVAVEVARHLEVLSAPALPA